MWIKHLWLQILYCMVGWSLALFLGEWGLSSSPNYDRAMERVIFSALGLVCLYGQMMCGQIANRTRKPVPKREIAH